MKLKSFTVLFFAFFVSNVFAINDDIVIQGKYSTGMFVEFKTTYIATVDHRKCMSKFYTETGESWLEPKQVAGKTKVKQAKKEFAITAYEMRSGFCQFERKLDNLQFKVHHPHLTMLGREFKDVFYLVPSETDEHQTQVIKGVKIGEVTNFSNKIKWDSEQIFIGPSGKINVEFIVE